ncbi:hypothetical protein [Geitlerinema sp. PCC 9228]|uniref:hypothetical protein n=1 Tax=Geitlerinema sp. PCC 9228 TaxID=111611 RepID=UPI0008F9B6B9|nr:hypothetical protein [Geitlerinema sp. PCC 9228]
MGTPSRYWQLAKLTAAGTVLIVEIPSAKEFFRQQFPHIFHSDSIADTNIEPRLLALWQDPQYQEKVSLCWRCYISHQICRVCSQLEKQFGQQHGFNRDDLLPLVLNDSLESIKSMASASVPSYQPLAVQILQTFNPQRGSLANWVDKLVKRDRELNRFLLQHGVYLASDWAILNDTQPKQLTKILGEFHQYTHAEIEFTKTLLASYHRIYRAQRLRQKQQGYSHRCLPPTQSQLTAIAQDMQPNLAQQQSPETILEQLQSLADRLRQYRIYRRGGFMPSQSLDIPETSQKLEYEQYAAPLPARENDTNNTQAQIDFLQFYRQEFVRSLDRSLEAVLRDRLRKKQRQKTTQSQKLLQGLFLFHCQGMAMGDIAQQLELKAQYQVTRLLQLKEFRTDVRQKMILDLKDSIWQQLRQYKTPQELQNLEANIEIALNEQVETAIAAAEKEASFPKKNAQQSLFAQRLCRLLREQFQLSP